jgi:hypothetical protein
MGGIDNLVLWKPFLEILSSEKEIIQKKREALEKLFNNSRISQFTYNYINKELKDAAIEIESRQRVLTEKMVLRAKQLEEQIKTLERFLADLEMHHTAGEIEEQPYTHQGNAITLGLKATKRELNILKEALIQLIPEENRSLLNSKVSVRHQNKIEDQKKEKNLGAKINT